MKTRDEILKEIARVEIAITHSKRDYLRKDYEKYLRRLRVELRRCGK
jgi:hypothetical protein